MSCIKRGTKDRVLYICVSTIELPSAYSAPCFSTACRMFKRILMDTRKTARSIRKKNSLSIFSNYFVVYFRKVLKLQMSCTNIHESQWVISETQNKEMPRKLTPTFPPEASAGSPQPSHLSPNFTWFSPSPPSNFATVSLCLLKRNWNWQAKFFDEESQQWQGGSYYWNYIFKTIGETSS